VTVLQAAVSRPPHLAAVVAVITGSDYHDNWTYVNGVFDQWFAQSWLGGWARVDAERRRQKTVGDSMDAINARDAQMHDALLAQLPEWNRKLPLAGLEVFHEGAPFYYDWLAHPDYSPYWEPVDLERHYADIQVPVLLVGGWYDIFSVGTIRNFIGLRGGGGSALARSGARLEMYPLCHGECSDTLSFAPKFWGDGVPPLSQDWWEHWLKGADNAAAHAPAVKLWVMSPPEQGNQDAGHWVTGDSYPLPGTRMARWSLASGGHANTRTGDGRLLDDHYRTGAGAARQIVRGLASPDHFTYDPNDPVPTLGGNLCCNEKVYKPGAMDQAALELRKDVLVYTSEALAHDVTVIGPVQLHFWARSSAPDTDFTAKLVDVRPDGVALNVLDRIVNAGLRHDSKRARSPIQPGKAYAYDMLVGNTALVFKAGHRIRLEVSSSNFPHYARNPNTGEPAATATRLVPAQQTVLHDAAHGSWLELPVVDPRP
jgi:putative CocE/NonD family hydrolase